MALSSRFQTQEFDAPRVAMLIVTLILVCTGIIVVFSASVGESFDSGAMDSTSNLIKQIGLAAVGVVTGVVIYFIGTPAVLRKLAVQIALAVVSFVLIVATAVSGLSALGATRWIELGPISLQPSEFIKIALILNVCADWAEYEESGRLEIFWGKVCLLVFLPLGLLLTLQSDLGSTMIISVGIIAVLFLGGVKTRYIIAVFVLVAVVAIFSIVFSSYRANRMYFMDPWSDGQNGRGNGLQLARSIYAFAKGGLFGVGAGASSEKLIMPESETDFIYAIIGEEYGFIGAIAVVILFMLMLVSGLLISHRADNTFSRTMAGGLTVMLVFQAFLNMCCVTGLAPTTGKTLPFLSSGGSSMIASIWMVSLILSSTRSGSSSSVYDRRRENLRIVRASGSGSSSRRTGGAYSRTRPMRPNYR